MESTDDADEFVWSDTANANAPSMGASSSPRPEQSRVEAGESGGSSNMPEDTPAPSMGVDVGESGGSLHLPENSANTSTGAAENTWFSNEAFQVGESGGSADLPQASPVSNVESTDADRLAYEDAEDEFVWSDTANANAPSMGASSGPRPEQSRVEAGESGGSSNMPEETPASSMGFDVGESGGSLHLPESSGNTSAGAAENTWFSNEAFQVGESGGSADLPQASPVSNVESTDADRLAHEDAEDEFVWSDTANANAPGMGASSSPRPEQSRVEAGESGGSSNMPDDTPAPSMGFDVGESGGSVHLPESSANTSTGAPENTWFSNEAFQVGESGGSADLPQASPVSNVESTDADRLAHEDAEDEFVWSDTANANAPGMGASSSPRPEQSRVEAGESGGSSNMPEETPASSMGFDVGESGGSLHLPESSGNTSTGAPENTWFSNEAFQVGESGGSADLPQASPVSNVESTDADRLAHEDAEDEFVWSDTANANAPSMGASSGPRPEQSRVEAGESGGSSNMPDDTPAPSMGFDVGESGGSVHLPESSANTSTGAAENTWFSNEAFQVGESGGSADLPQASPVSNVENADADRLAPEDAEDEFVWSDTANANAPSMGASSSPRPEQSRVEAGESGGSSNMPEDTPAPSMGFDVGESGGSLHLPESSGNTSTGAAENTWFSNEAFQVGESGGSADLPQASPVSNVESTDADRLAHEDAEDEFVWSDTANANAPSMGASSSPRPEQSRVEAGESGGSSNMPEDTPAPSMGFDVGESGGSLHLPESSGNTSTGAAENTWFSNEAFQVGESGGSADLPQASPVSNVENADADRLAPEDAEDEFVWSETANANAPSMGASSSPRPAQSRVEAGESGGSSNMPQDTPAPSMGFDVGESGGSLHLPESSGNTSAGAAENTWFANEAFQVGESGGSADLPQASPVSNVESTDADRLAYEDAEDEFVWSDTANANAPSMSASSSPRPEQSRVEAGESGGSFHVAQDVSSQPGDSGGMPSAHRTSQHQTRGDIGGDDPALERSGDFQHHNVSATLAMGSGGSGGSGDGGYPTQQDPGGTDEQGEQGAEGHLPAPNQLADGSGWIFFDLCKGISIQFLESLVS